MSVRLQVAVHGDDPISRAGVATQLRGRPEATVVESEPGTADVAIVVLDTLDELSARDVRAITRAGTTQVLLVLTTVDDAALLLAAEVGASGVLRRKEATPESLASAVVAAAQGCGTLAPDLLGRLIGQVSRLQRQVLAPKGIGPAGLTERELEVLRLLAEGHGTGEIATRMAYSERTIKNVIHDVTARLNLKNRSHAVAYALKAGLI